jgi:hypothetical protein
MKLNHLRLLLPLVILAGAPTGRAQWTQRGPSGALSKTEATKLVVAINHVEAENFSRTHAYLSLEKLPLDRLSAAQKVFSASQIESGSVKDHKLRVIASADGKHYLLAVVPVPSGCAFSIFSDESANIFVAPQLDCSDEH